MPPEVIDKFSAQIEAMQPDIQAVLDKASVGVSCCLVAALPCCNFLRVQVFVCQPAIELLIRLIQRGTCFLPISIRCCLILCVCE